MTPVLAAALSFALAQSGPVIAASSRRPTPPPLPACTHRPTPAGTELMLVALYEGETLSSAWVGDPDKETSVIPFEVAPGPPVHLVITGYGQNVYRFSGRTDRIHRLTLMGHAPSAVTGLPRASVEFAAACLPYGLFQARGTLGVEAASRAFGRTPASIVYEYSPFALRIDTALRIDPSPPPRRGSGDNHTDLLYQFSPGGVAEVNPRRLVSAAPVGAYVTLPQEAGIRQLVRAGALVPATEADARAWEARARRRGLTGDAARAAYMREAYRVTRPIAVPSGLCGSHSVYFYAPTPAYLTGDPCHSTFYFADGTRRGSG